MEIMYRSTRSEEEKVTASEAILKGLADDGGLFVPTGLPKLDVSLEALASMNYQEAAYEVMKLFLTDFTEEELKGCIAAAYDDKFDTAEIAPLKAVNGAYYLELFHGPTIAFKDMALSILPHLMITAARKNHEEKEIVILTATSGDTGKAALAGFADVPGTRIIVFYPKDGVSSIQERQMVTQKGENTCVIGIRGNFDDAQSGVKKIFTNPEEKEKLAKAGFQFSSANSINIGRLVPQIAYYVWAYTRLGTTEAVNFVVPTGNFGNILAGYYAMQLGIPVQKLICASNSNKVLFDFFQTGEYDRNREFVLTTSPSMDILISSNLERLIFHIAGDDAAVNAAYMKDLAEKGSYHITEEMKERLAAFCSGWASEEETAAEIRRRYEEDRYVIDPHTAVASAVYGQYRKRTGDETKTVVVSTASPFKFETSVMSALGQPCNLPDLELADALSEISGVAVPEAVASLKNARIRHTTVCGRTVEEMTAEVERFLGL
jgi:threonine synthase